MCAVREGRTRRRVRSRLVWYLLVCLYLFFWSPTRTGHQGDSGTKALLGLFGRRNTVRTCGGGPANDCRAIVGHSGKGRLGRARRVSAGGSGGGIGGGGGSGGGGKGGTRCSGSGIGGSGIHEGGGCSGKAADEEFA
jgi:hypothetical protein